MDGVRRRPGRAPARAGHDRSEPGQLVDQVVQSQRTLRQRRHVPGLSVEGVAVAPRGPFSRPSSQARSPSL